MRHQRWSDHDHYWGPFTLAYPDHHGLGVMLDSGHGEYPGCSIRFYLGKLTLLVALPQIIQPYRERHWPCWDAETVQRLGRDYYDEEFAREFGFNFAGEGTLHVRWGRQTHSSNTTRSRCFFLPWANWRHVRLSYYEPNHAHFWTEPERDRSKPIDFDSPEYWSNAKDRCPSVTFDFYDYDGERIKAQCVIEEREWRFGTGWFKWLSLFIPRKIRRSLDIKFSAETGKRKGSWKGGTIGHGIDMSAGESPESAFRRYCREHNMTFVGLSRAVQGQET